LAVYTALLENSAKPVHRIEANEYDDTAVSTDLRCVYDKQFVVGDDMYRIFDPMLLGPVVESIAPGVYTSPTAREYIVEITANGFVNIHHRMPIAYGQSYNTGQSIVLENGWRLPTTLLPSGAGPLHWPVGFGYGLFTTSNVANITATENVVWLFNDWYDVANFGTTISISFMYENFMVDKSLIGEYLTAEFIQKMTTDSYTHKYYALGTTLGISKHTDGNNEDVTCRIRILRRQLTAYPLINLLTRGGD
jgi:hypothetical protein